MKLVDFGHGERRANRVIAYLNKKVCSLCGALVPIRSKYRRYCCEAHKKEYRRRYSKKYKAKLLLDSRDF